ncbi:MAG: hypothetical protein ABW146_02215 [Candidatus Sedimenticola sp. 6PFRAG7]
MNKDNCTETELAPVLETNKERREALKKMGAFTAYTAPAMLAMLTTSRASADSAPG